MNTAVERSEPSLVSGILLAISGTFLFALKSIFIKLAFAEGASVEVVLVLRMLLAFPFYVAMLLYLHQRQLIKGPLNRPNILKILMLGFLGYYLASYLDLAGLELISAQLERITLFTYPAIITVLAWLFLGEKINRFIIVALILCYSGIFTMYSQEKTLLEGQQTGLGVLLVMGAALSFSFYVLFAKPIMQQIGSRAFTSIAMIGSTGFVLIHFSLTMTLADLNVSWTIWMYAALLAFVSTVIPSFLMSEAIVRIGASRASILGSVGPVFTMLLAVLLLNEPTSWQHALGMLLVIAGVSLVGRKS